jgi:DNA-binding transcriptional regulator LsrR (DeoR family)
MSISVSARHFNNLFDLEARLKAVFGIQEAIVIPAVGDTSSALC